MSLLAIFPNPVKLWLFKGGMHICEKEIIIKCIVRDISLDTENKKPKNPTRIVYRPAVTTRIKFQRKRKHEPMPVLFHIDTGTSKTILSTPDSIKLGLNLNELPDSKIDFRGVGGYVSKDQVAVLEGTILTFMTNHGLYDAPIDEIYIIKSGEGTKFPSLLGLDFFHETGFKICYDVNGHIAKLFTGKSC